MSLRRLAATTAVMAAAAALLRAVTPPWLAELDVGSVVRDPQAFVDTVGPDAVLLAGAASLAWLAWSWGMLGLTLTALSAAPGLVGALARATGRLLLPAGMRRASAVALGVGLAVGAPALSACSTGPEPVAVVQSAPSSGPPAAEGPAVVPRAAPQVVPDAGAVPDWPVAPATTTAAAAPAPAPGGGPTHAPPAAVPDWPSGEHVVVRGDSLWRIAAADLRDRTGAEPAHCAVAAAVDAWWAVNADVIGPDPDLLLPGQVLRAPAAPAAPAESGNHA